MIVFLCKQANICVSALLNVSLRKSTPEIREKFLRFFTFFIYENINQEYNLLPDCVFGSFTYVCSKNCMSGFSAIVLKLTLEKRQVENVCSVQHHCHW